MDRAVTAIYRSHAVAGLVRNELERLGVGRHHITSLPSARIVPNAPAPSGSDVNRDNLANAFDRLHDLYLPENDVRTYQQAIRNGDYVVSVSVDDEPGLNRVREIMHRPEEAYDLNELDASYSGAAYEPRRHPLEADYHEGQNGRRHNDQVSPYTRTYQRDLPLVPPLVLGALPSH